MKSFSKFLIIFIIAVVIMSISVPASALPSGKTVREKAELLSNLKIIAAPDGDYKLNDKLRRCEAIAFFVRIIGKDKHVADNKAIYSITPFTDVSAREWYAPNIGYCYEVGYIKNTNQRFEPLQFIMEKDFLRLILLALDYKENIDFTSDTIYEKSRELGLISLTTYINNFNSMIITDRTSAVNILYAAIDTKCKTGDKLFQKLINEGVVTKERAAALGLVNDPVQTGIIFAHPVEEDILVIKLNEEIVSVSGIRVYSKSNGKDSLNCSMRYLSGDTITIETSAQETEKEYIIELNNVKDKDGNVTNQVLGSFTGFVPSEVNSDYFRINRIVPDSSRSIKVYFTHPLNTNSEVPLHYSIKKGNAVVADGKQISAGVLNSEKNALLLSFFAAVLEDNESYTLSIDGDLTSAYGVCLNDGLGDEMKFTAKSNNIQKFMLLNAGAVDSRTVLMNFNKEVNPFLAGQIFNFYLTSFQHKPIRIVNTVVGLDGRSVYLRLDQDMIKGQNYYLTVNLLNDITKREYITEESFSFNAAFGAAEKFELAGVKVIDNQCMEVSFNKAPDSELATETDYYFINRSGAVIKPHRVIYDPVENPNTVKLYFSGDKRLFPQFNYDLTMDGRMKDLLGNNISFKRIKFNGTNNDGGKTAISSIVPISSGAVKVAFSREIEFCRDNLLPANYVLSYTHKGINISKVPVSIIYADAKTLILAFDSLEPGTDYTLEAKNVTDYGGNTVKGIEGAFSLAPR